MHRWTSLGGISFFFFFSFFLFRDKKKTLFSQRYYYLFVSQKIVGLIASNRLTGSVGDIVGSVTLKCSHFQVWFSAATRILHGCPFRHHYLGSAPLYVTFSTRVPAKEVRFPSTETKGRNLRSLNGVQTVSLESGLSTRPRVCSACVRLPRIKCKRNCY